MNEYKEIKPVIHNGRKMYTCEKCRAFKLPIGPMQKHVLSLVHKNNHKQGDVAQLDQECKEMKKKGRVSTSYLCTPCGFTSDSVIATKNHIMEEAHKKRTVNYCHACKAFSNNRAKYQEHRFSIAHKRKMEELEKPYEEKKEEKSKPKTKDKDSEEGVAKSKDAIEEAAPKEPEDPLKCKCCAFEAKTEDEMSDHIKSENHRRKYYLATGKFDTDQEEELGTKPFTSLEHMSMIHRAKDIHDKANKSKSIRVDEDLKKEKNMIVEILFKNGVFEKLGCETTIKCTTCNVKLQGHAQVKKLNAQLFVHFVGDKHIQRLRVQVKGEDASQRESDQIASETVAIEEASTEVESLCPYINS